MSFFIICSTDLIVNQRFKLIKDIMDPYTVYLYTERKLRINFFLIRIE